MKERTISGAEAFEMANRPEGHFFDRKSLQISGTALQKIVVAFANADGGEVVVGICDDKEEPAAPNRWKGAPKIETFNGLLQAVHSLSPTAEVRYEFLRRLESSTYALRIFVERGAEVNKLQMRKCFNGRVPSLSRLQATRLHSLVSPRAPAHTKI